MLNDSKSELDIWSRVGSCLSSYIPQKLIRNCNFSSWNEIKSIVYLQDGK